MFKYNVDRLFIFQGRLCGGAICSGGIDIIDAMTRRILLDSENMEKHIGNNTGWWFQPI